MRYQYVVTGNPDEASRGDGFRSARRVEQLRAKARARPPRARALWFALSHPQVLLEVAHNPDVAPGSPTGSRATRLLGRRAWRKLARDPISIGPRDRDRVGVVESAWIEALCRLAAGRSDRLELAAELAAEAVVDPNEMILPVQSAFSALERAGAPLSAYGILFDICEAALLVDAHDLASHLVEEPGTAPGVRLLAAASTWVRTARQYLDLEQAREEVLVELGDLKGAGRHLGTLPAPVLEVAAGLVVGWDQGLPALLDTAHALVG